MPDRNAVCPDNRNPRQWRLIRFLALNAAIGTCVALILVGVLIWTDTHAIGRLILGDRNPVLSIALLTFGFVITFGSVAMGTAIMALPYDGSGSDRGSRKSAARFLSVVKAPARARPGAGDPIPAAAGAARNR